MGFAMNQEMTDDGTFHYDRNDHKFGLNAIIGWGNFKSMSLALHYPKIKIEMTPGDLFLFLGRNFIHGAVDVVGTRSMINCFVHDGMIVWGKERKNYAHGSFGPTKANLKGKVRGKSPEPPKWRVSIKSKIPKRRGPASETQSKLSGKSKAKPDVSDSEEESESDSNGDGDDEEDTLSLDSEDEATIFAQNRIVYQGMQNNAAGTLI